jgi:hypothetical protein
MISYVSALSFGRYVAEDSFVKTTWPKESGVDEVGSAELTSN